MTSRSTLSTSSLHRFHISSLALRKAPDLSTDLTLADYRAGRDLAMDAILWYKPGASIRAAADKNDYAVAKDALMTFIKDPLHKYATAESDINRLGYEFLNAKKLDQTLFVLKAERRGLSRLFQCLG